MFSIFNLPFLLFIATTLYFGAWFLFGYFTEYQNTTFHGYKAVSPGLLFIWNRFMRLCQVKNNYFINFVIFIIKITRMKKIFLFFIALLIISIVQAQNVGIGTNTPSTSALLDLTSGTKGFLPPRMLAAQRDTINNPVAGLIIYCSNCGVNGEWQGYNGTAWTNLIGGAATTALSIGDTYKGGKIAYILQVGDPGYIAGEFHGLIAAAFDLGGSSTWGCSGIPIDGADSITLGTGNQNTSDIVAGCGFSFSAARKCWDLVQNGYSDWFLPSKDELNKLYINRLAIGNFSSSAFYWSSSEYDDSQAWSQTFNGGGQYPNYKSGNYNVRPIRTF